MYYDDEINWDLVQKNMEDDAEEVYEHYKKQFPTDDYKKIAELLAKAYLFAKDVDKSCDAYEDWSMTDNYAYAVLGMLEEYCQYGLESAEYDRGGDDRFCDEPDYADCYDDMRGW
jgi:hypothetical protein